MRLDKAKDCSIQKYLETSSKNAVYGCNLKLVQGRALLFHQTRSHAVVLHDTRPAVCIEKVVCMKTKDELFQKVRWTPRVPRVVLKSNSQIGLQDQRAQDARTSYDQPSGSKSSWETGATPWITEFLIFLFLQLNRKIHFAKTRSNS